MSMVSGVGDGSAGGASATP